MEERDHGGGAVHPLLVPSVLSVLAEHLHSRDVAVCMLVCQSWNKAIRRSTGPLMNPRIISILIEHLPKASILTCRFVCSVWNHTIINSRRWRNPEDVEEIQWNSCFQPFRVDGSDFQRFSEKFGDPDVLPMPLGFSHFTAPNNISLNDGSTQDFVDRYGRFLKSIELYRCKWTLEDLRHLLFECCLDLESLKIVCGIIPGTQVGKGRKVSVPELECVLHEDPADFKVLDKLKRLQIDMNILDSKDRVRAYVEQFFIELFSSAPNIEVINFDFSSWYARTWATNFIASNEGIQLGKLRVLEHLIDPDLECVLNLTKKQFPLSKLKIRIRYKDVTLEALHDLLRSLKGTLTDLQLVFLEYKCAREFPSSLELGKLKRFELWKFKGELGFLKGMSSLEELVLGEMELKGQEVFCRRSVFKDELPGVRVTFKDYWESKVFS